MNQHEKAKCIFIHSFRGFIPWLFKGSGERHDTKADMCGELPVHNKAAKTQLERQERTEFFTNSSKMDLH